MAKAMGDVHGKGDMEYLMSDMEVTFFLYYLATGIYMPSIQISLYEDTIAKITTQRANLHPKTHGICKYLVELYISNQVQRSLELFSPFAQHNPCLWLDHTQQHMPS